MGSQGVRLQWITWGFKRLQGLQEVSFVTMGYSRLQRVTLGYKGLQRVTVGLALNPLT